MKTALLAAVIGGIAFSGTEASAENWTIHFSHGPLDVISIPYRDGGSRTAYFMTFVLKNKTDKDIGLNLRLNAVIGHRKKRMKDYLALPDKAVEETVRRLGRAKDLLNVQQLNKRKVIKAGETLRGIAVFGNLDRHWDVCRVNVEGLEPRSFHSRIRKYGNAYTVPHRAYGKHNAAVEAKADAAKGKSVDAIVAHRIVWTMKYTRAGDEFAPQEDEIVFRKEGWKVASTKILLEKTSDFSKK